MLNVPTACHIVIVEKNEKLYSLILLLPNEQSFLKKPWRPQMI